MLPQLPEVAAVHIAIYKLGAVALPLAVLFGTDALSYRLGNSGAAALITNARGAERLAEIRKDLPALGLVLSLDGAGDGALAFADMLAKASTDFSPVDTSADDPAMMIFPSGTTGQPKGALAWPPRTDRAFPGCRKPITIFSRSQATASGRRPIGRGLVDCSMFFCLASTMASRWWRDGSRNSIRKKPSR